MFRTLYVTLKLSQGVVDELTVLFAPNFHEHDGLKNLALVRIPARWRYVSYLAERQGRFGAKLIEPIDQPLS